MLASACSLMMAAHVLTVIFTSYMLFIAWPGSSLFSWHPTLMTLAFALLMFEGLLVFNKESSVLAGAARPTKTLAHWVLQGLAVGCATLGFLVIFYNKWNRGAAHFTSWHGLLGVATVCYANVQSVGGAFVKYPQLRGLIGMKLKDLKLYHATSGLILFTLVCTTLMLSLYTNWFENNVHGVYVWYACLGFVSFMAVIVMNQITQEYLPLARAAKPAPVVSPTDEKQERGKRKQSS